MLGVEQESVHESGDGWCPIAVRDNLVVMSIAFLLQNRSEAVIWRGARKSALIKQFLKVNFSCFHVINCDAITLCSLNLGNFHLATDYSRIYGRKLNSCFEIYIYFFLK